MGHNHAAAFTAVASALPERECVVFRDRRLTYGAIAERATRLANLLLEHGITVRRERDGLKGCESGQDLVGLYLHNGNEYLAPDHGRVPDRLFDALRDHLSDEQILELTVCVPPSGGLLT